MLNCVNQRRFSGGGDTSTEGPKGDFSRGISQALETIGNAEFHLHICERIIQISSKARKNDPFHYIINKK